MKTNNTALEVIFLSGGHVDFNTHNLLCSPLITLRPPPPPLRLPVVSLPLSSLSTLGIRYKTAGLRLL